MLGVSRMSRPLLWQMYAIARLHTQSRTFTISRYELRSTQKSTQHEKDDFYEYYLNYKLRDQDLSRILWPKQPVTPNPDLTLLGEQQSNADSVAYVLDCFMRSHQRHAEQPIAKTLDQYREAKPGSLALNWLLHTEKTRELANWEHARLLKLIVHCLIAEGNLDVLIEWILAKDAPTRLSSEFAKSPHLWRGQLLSYTVQAQGYWTQGSLLLEDSVQTYLSMKSRAEGHVYISYALTAEWLFHLLAMRTPPIVTATSHEKFTSLMAVWRKRSTCDLEFPQARLSMTHPLRPDPFPALHLMQKHVDLDWDRWVAAFISPAGKSSSAMGWLFFVTTAQLLAKKGSVDDAKWVLDLGRKSLPLKFQMTKFRGGSTTNRRRLPTPEEAAAGLVDSEGYFLSMSRRTSAYANNATASTSSPDRRASGPIFTYH